MELSGSISDGCRDVWKAEAGVHIPLTFGGNPIKHELEFSSNLNNGYMKASQAIAPNPTRIMAMPEMYRGSWSRRRALGPLIMWARSRRNRYMSICEIVSWHSFFRFD